jgi:CRISPR system Cascade subunit CasC
MLVQIHMIQNHAPSNLNRDDTGSPKEAIFGGVARARISSQCLKRSIRQSAIFQEAMAGYLGKRTRRLPGELRAALLSQGADEAIADEIALKATAFGSGKESEDNTTRQLIFLNPKEIDSLAEKLKAIYDADPKAFKKMKIDELEKRLKEGSDASLPCSVDIALFGRMTTTSVFEDVQAAAQVAHAISTTRVEHQFDYFTAVDDLKTADEDDHGAGMIGDVEFNSATYYKYFAIDVDALTTTLGGEAEIARQAVAAFLKAAALTTPTGKQNTFAAHNVPDAILVEVSDSHVPVNYANAFVAPVRAMKDTDVVTASVEQLSEYAADVNRAYGLERQSFLLATRGMAVEGAQPVDSLGTLVSELSEALAVYAE